MMTATLLPALLALATAAVLPPVTPDDIARLRHVSSPAVAPGGEWVAYAVGGSDVAGDRQYSHIWMTSWDGSRTVQLTARDGESESSPHFSPDGRSLAFISARGDEQETDQLWLMDRAGGEARRLPGITGSVVEFAWSPDSRTLALAIVDPDPDEAANAAARAVTPSPARPGTGPEAPPTGESSTVKPAKAAEKPPKPIVIDRYRFKRDIDGYLGKQRQRLWLYDLATARMRRLTTGDYDEALPAWSPDGRRIAFTSNRSADPDRNYDSNLYVAAVAATPVEPLRLTTFEGEDNDAVYGSLPAWSPDGSRIAYIEGGPPALFSYGVRKLAVISASGGAPTVLTAGLDRNVHDPVWSADSKTLRFLIEDDGNERLASIAASGGPITAITDGSQVFAAPAAGPGDRLALLHSTSTRPFEVVALDRPVPGQAPRRLSHQNDAWLATVALAPATPIAFASKDGTPVHGFEMRPPGSAADPRPTLLYLHGGPQSQHDSSFDIGWQILAGAGYTVLAPNPRGSSGRGEAFCKAIYAAWGSVDVDDALATVDDAVKRGTADPRRLGVLGWSYGGMLTNYVIASDTRFKAAVSGASTSNAWAGYGTDQYVLDYETELGKPWEKPDAWARVSYPFLHNDRIVTPTLFMVGDKDFNVPLLNSEQMYQALRSRDVPTQLVIYPGEFHGIKRPSFQKDRVQRWLGWFEARLK